MTSGSPTWPSLKAPDDLVQLTWRPHVAEDLSGFVGLKVSTVDLLMRSFQKKVKYHGRHQQGSKNHRTTHRTIYTPKSGSPKSKTFREIPKPLKQKATGVLFSPNCCQRCWAPPAFLKAPTTPVPARSSVGKAAQCESLHSSILKQRYPQAFWIEHPAKELRINYVHLCSTLGVHRLLLGGRLVRHPIMESVLGIGDLFLESQSKHNIKTIITLVDIMSSFINLSEKPGDVEVVRGQRRFKMFQACQNHISEYICLSSLCASTEGGHSKQGTLKSDRQQQT